MGSTKKSNHPNKLAPPPPRVDQRFRPSWFTLYGPLAIFGTVVVGTILGMTYQGLLALVALLPVHFLILPRLALNRIPQMERRMLFAIYQGRRDRLPWLWTRSVIIRLYGPPWLTLSKAAWVAYSMNQLDRAERLYTEALNLEDNPQRAIQMANLATTKDRLGKHDEAEALRQRVQRTKPGMADILKVTRESDPT